MIVTMEHLDAAGLCVSRRQAYFVMVGLDFEAFKIHGLPIEQVEALGHPVAIRAAEACRKMDNDGR